MLISGISVVKVVKILLTDKSFQFILYSDCYGIFAGICLVRMNLFSMGILFLMKHGSYQTYCFVYCSFLCTFYWKLYVIGMLWVPGVCCYTNKTMFSEGVYGFYVICLSVHLFVHSSRFQHILCKIFCQTFLSLTHSNLGTYKRVIRCRSRSNGTWGLIRVYIIC